MLISVIIPVYDVEGFLARCLQSIAEQTYKKLEIILVDDGSTDNSGKICDEFAKEDKRVVVLHKENGGLSSARNAGLDVAHGDYVTFVDSDDYLAPNFIEVSVGLCIEKNAQIAVMDMKYIKENEDKCVWDNRVTYTMDLNPEQAIEESLYQRHFSCCAPAKLYKRQLIGDIRFPLGRLSEDLATCHLFLDRANRIVYTNEIGYFYRQRNSSIMHDFNMNRMDAIIWARDIESFCKDKYPRITDAATCRLFNVAVHLLLDLPRRGEVYNAVVSELLGVVRGTRNTVLLDKKCRNREKIAALLSYFGEDALRFIWNSRLAKRKDK
ncbi:glycosyltransferase [uncultured Anaerovibrio sp.]|uniref:glycosyltransferase family 2 protein n=1 Tax=uncultured Anaerovibrio sp. TaxID=361586 RepID=UPI00261CF32E|nr:glycosyltransferase [uncultured Anaerovibrio sp.]